MGSDVRIVLVRHGETPWVVEDRFQGLADTRLSPRGEAQAAAVGRRLADPAAPPPLPLPATDPVAIWHSPLERAAATARGVAGARGRPDLLVAMPDLVETHVGDWEGLTNVEVAERWPEELAAWRLDPSINHIPGGEPYPEAALRVRRALDAAIVQLEAAPGTDPAWGIAVSHGGFVRLAILTLLAIPLDRYWSFPVGAAAITIVERRDDGPWRLRLHGLEPGVGASAG
jgi:probable phosphoglycerate mutase